MNKLISVIAPMYNEEVVVSEYCEVTLKTLRNIAGYDHEILLIDDGSQDNTYNEMLRMQEKHPKEIGVVYETRNYGLEGAVSAGLRTSRGDIAVVMDADLQDPPELIVDMLKKIEEGADIVVGSRINRSNDSFTKKFTAGLYYKILDSLSGKLKLERCAANYRMLTRRAIDQWCALPESNGVFRVTVPYIGMRTETVEYDRNKRVAGETKYHFKAMFEYAINSLTGISVAPLTKLLWTLLGSLLIFLISLIGMIITEDYWKMGWMVVMMVSILSGLILFTLSLMSVYLGQVLLEVKHRPISIVYDYKPSMNSKIREEESNEVHEAGEIRT